MQAPPPNVTIRLSHATHRIDASLRVYFPPVAAPEPASSAAVIVVPGGSYRPGPFGWCKIAEGADVAVQLAQAGHVGIVMHYRLPAGRPEVPLIDVLEAMEIVRQQPPHLALPLASQHWSRSWAAIHPRRVGVMGFSAGGHLAALAATKFTSQVNRPDFAILMYPVVSLENNTHANSKREYVGPQATSADLRAYSADRHVSANTPPTFLAHALDDKIVPPASSRMYFDACWRQGAACTLVEMSEGGHPFITKLHAWEPARYAALSWLRATVFARDGAASSSTTSASGLAQELRRLPNVARVHESRATRRHQHRVEDGHSYYREVESEMLRQRLGRSLSWRDRAMRRS